MTAKFLKLEQLEQEIDPAETTGVSLDGTGQIGTYFYTAPEIEQRWPKINEKVSMSKVKGQYMKKKSTIFSHLGFCNSLVASLLPLLSP